MADVTTGIQFKFGKTVYQNPQSGVAAAIQLVQEAWEGEYVQVKQALQMYLSYVAGILFDRNSKPWPGGTSSGSLSSRTGLAAGSIVRSVKVTGTSWERLSGTIGGVSYLWIHEYGGRIGGGKLLTIPLPAALSPRGTSPPFTRQWKNTFVARSRAGNLIIFQKRGRDIVPLYVLKTSVQIPARLGMRAELSNQIPYFLGQAADMVVSDFLKQLGVG